MDLIEITFGHNKYHLQKEMIQWCIDNIGPGDWRIPDPENQGDVWGIETAFGTTRFYFVNEKDSVMFSLKWG